MKKKTMQTAFLALTLAAVMAVGAPGRADAATITFVPADATVVQGPLDVELWVTDLAGATITGFNVVLDVNSSVLTLDSYTFGAGLLPGSANALDLSTPGNPFEFFYTNGDSFLDLNAAQAGDSFLLATLTFTAVPGFSPLNLSAVVGAGATQLTQIFDDESLADLGATLVDGSRCVAAQSTTEVCAAPEPGTWALLGAGLAAFFVARRYATAKNQA